jgi:alkanesulfonate monooxygenase SsuD/methylene tetrahydromethanopterin reductase-like flavin-dependent oxidoreductase (luciferase family)
MEFGIFTEFAWAPGATEADAFDESIAQMLAAEELGLDAVWLAELHFQKDRSVLSSPLVVASALAARTRRVKLVIAVQVLPLSHPLRLAEDVATLDHLSRGRLEFGIGRSGLPGHYQGFNIPYRESRDRFLETLDILVQAWTRDRFTHEGKHFQFRDVCVIPKPYQKPHPPIRVAATTPETFALVGRLGYPLFVAVRTSSIGDLREMIGGYHEGWAAAGHPGRGDIAATIPIYVADSPARAREEPEASTMHFFRSIAEALQRASAATQTPESRARAARLATLTYDDVLDQFAVFGTPECVADRLLALREEFGLSSLAAWMNPGGRMPGERVLDSMRLFADRVVPRLR